MSSVPPQVFPRAVRALLARTGNFATRFPFVRQVLKRGVARALPPRVLCAAPERIRCGRIGSVGLSRDFLNRSLGVGFFLVLLPEGSFPPAGTGCGPPGAGWQHVSCTGCARQRKRLRNTFLSCLLVPGVSPLLFAD